jgi:hypothetical protein
MEELVMLLIGVVGTLIMWGLQAWVFPNMPDWAVWVPLILLGGLCACCLYDD